MIKKIKIAMILSVFALILLPVCSLRAFAAYDTTPPVVTRATFDKTELTKPGVFSLSIDITEEETGLSQWTIFFIDADTGNMIPSDAILFPEDRSQPGQGSIHTFNTPVFSGTVELKFALSSKCPSGRIAPAALILIDQQGNEAHYYSKYFNPSDDFEVTNFLSVKDAYEVAFQSHVSNQNITSKIEEMPDGSTCMINYDQNNSIAKAEWFDAIKGLNKTIIFSNDGYQWLFHGKDIITETKDIDLQFSIRNVKMSDYGSDEKAAEISFPKNGVLPGKATVMMKSDYLYNKGLSSELLLYYLKDNQLINEKDPNFDMELDGMDKWCHFDISHNLKYYVSPVSLNKYGSPSTKITKLNSSKNAVTIKWSKKSCSGYQIRYSTKNNMKGSKTISIKNAKTTSRKITKLKSGKEYYMQIRTYKIVSGKKYYSAWNSIKSVKSK